jgi:glucose uptake protein GlcU
LVVFLFQGCPTFYPFALVGGFIWCTGNVGVPFVIKSIGLGPGLVTWGTSALLIGWLTGFFGLFGLNNERPCMQSIPLNVVGFALAVCAFVDSTLIRKGKRLDAKPDVQGGAREPFSSQENSGGGAPDSEAVGETVEPQEEAAAGTRLMGMLCAAGMGLCFGTNFHPSSYIQENPDVYPGASTNGLDYVFNQFCGILLASIVYFLIYCGYKRNKPEVNPELILPTFLSGVMWAIAQTCWFVANADIGYSAAFPIILIGPGFVGSMWSIFLFKDIYGPRNYNVLAAYFVIACSACACIVLSRKTDPPPPCAS